MADLVLPAESKTRPARSRRQMPRVLGGLASTMLGIRAISEHAEAQGQFTRPEEALAPALHILQPYELPLFTSALSTQKERREQGR
jgi:hypothetical protein